MDAQLIDASGFIHRAFHAVPMMHRPSDGQPINAVYGFSCTLWRLANPAARRDGPTHICIVFDPHGATFRHAIYPEYKSHRNEIPWELKSQYEFVKLAAKCMSLPTCEINGYEADDVIATLARMIVNAGGKVTIVSGDKDLCQLMRPSIRILDPHSFCFRTEHDIEGQFGVRPSKLADVLALMGDAADNVPGVPGIGVKTAARLINEYGCLEALLAHIDSVTPARIRQRLKDNTHLARLSRQLVELDDMVPIQINLDDLIVPPLECNRLIDFVDEMEFVTLRQQILQDLDCA